MSYGNTAGGFAGTMNGPFPQVRTDGVLSRRLVAYLVDLVVLFILVMMSGVLIGLAGVVTFGLGWTLYAVLVPGTALLYSAITVGGRSQGTIGMRLSGLMAIDAETGGRVGAITAALHALMFYVAAGTFLLLLADIAIGMARNDRRLGHDLLAGLLLIRRA